MVSALLDVLPPYCSARATSRSSRCAAHEQARGLPRYPEVSGQELKKTFVVRAPKPAENGKAPSTPSSSSSAAASSSADAFETPMSLDATEPRLLALGRRLLPGHGCHFAAWCAVPMRGQGGGLTAPDPLFPHVNMRSHSVHVRSCSFTGVWAHAVCFHEYLCS